MMHSVTTSPRPEHSGSGVRCSTLMLRALAEVALARGVTPEQLFGPEAEALLGTTAEATVPLSDLEVYFERAVELTRDPALGLYCGLNAADASFGLMSPLIAHAPTLRSGIALIRQFQSLLISGAHLRLTEKAGVAQLHYDLFEHGAAKRSVTDFVVAGLFRTLRAFGCQRSDIHAVCFAHSRPAHYPSYIAAFDGTERFSQSFTGIELTTQALDRPHLHHQPELHAVLLAQAERSLERQARPLSCTELVQALLVTCPAAKLPSMTLAAQRLGLSVRTLRRRLEEEGTSYRALSQAKLYEAALSLLRQPEASVHSVSHALGFSDPSAFHRAFRRWSKSTPMDFRSGRLEASH